MLKELLRIGFYTLVGAAFIESLDENNEMCKELRKLTEEINKLPNEFKDTTDGNDTDTEQTKVVQTVKNFKRAVNPVTRFVDHCLAMDVNTAKKVLKRGDHIYCVRSYYSHHGIYDGEGGVYHYSNTKSNDNGWLIDKDTMVSYSSLEAFVNSEYAEPNSKINVRYYKTELTGDEIIARCKERLGEQKYDVLYNNCEHFAYWARGYENFGN